MASTSSAVSGLSQAFPNLAAALNPGAQFNKVPQPSNLPKERVVFERSPRCSLRMTKEVKTALLAGGPMFPCNSCMIMFPLESGLRQHEDEFHPGDHWREKQLNDSNDPLDHKTTSIHVCKECGSIHNQKSGAEECEMRHTLADFVTYLHDSDVQREQNARRKKLIERRKSSSEKLVKVPKKKSLDDSVLSASPTRVPSPPIEDRAGKRKRTIAISSDDEWKPGEKPPEAPAPSGYPKHRGTRPASSVPSIANRHRSVRSNRLLKPTARRLPGEATSAAAAAASRPSKSTAQRVKNSSDLGEKKKKHENAVSPNEAQKSDAQRCKNCFVCRRDFATTMMMVEHAVNEHGVAVCGLEKIVSEDKCNGQRDTVMRDIVTHKTRCDHCNRPTPTKNNYFQHVLFTHKQIVLKSAADDPRVVAAGGDKRLVVGLQISLNAAHLPKSQSHRLDSLMFTVCVEFAFSVQKKQNA